MVPVICVDGPSGSGKGTLAQRLATHLGFHLLDSGALYRIVGFAALEQGIAWDDEASVTQIARDLDVSFATTDLGLRVIYCGKDVTEPVRSVRGGEGASAVAAIPSVREALLARQRELAAPPGLIADGRDMGTVVFPRAEVKLFVTASAQRRAERRYKQLIAKGSNVNLLRLLEEIEERDKRDRERATAPLKPADDAVLLDTSDLSTGAVFEIALDAIRSRVGFLT